MGPKEKFPPPGAASRVGTNFLNRQLGGGISERTREKKPGFHRTHSRPALVQWGKAPEFDPPNATPHPTGPQ